MSFALRIALFICAALLLRFVVVRIRKAQFDISDSLFWLLLSAMLVVLAIFPEIAFFCSELLGIQSPSNFVFLSIIALLIVRGFTQQVELAKLRHKLTALTQEIALRNTEK